MPTETLRHAVFDDDPDLVTTRRLSHGRAERISSEAKQLAQELVSEALGDSETVWARVWGEDGKVLADSFAEPEDEEDEEADALRARTRWEEAQNQSTRKGVVTDTGGGLPSEGDRLWSEDGAPYGIVSVDRQNSTGGLQVTLRLAAADPSGAEEDFDARLEVR